jgi:hypothetical protein
MRQRTIINDKPTIDVSNGLTVAAFREALATMDPDQIIVMPADAKIELLEPTPLLGAPIDIDSNRARALAKLTERLGREPTPEDIETEKAREREAKPFRAFRVTADGGTEEITPLSLDEAIAEYVAETAHLGEPDDASDAPLPGDAMIQAHRRAAAADQIADWTRRHELFAATKEPS